MLIIQKRSDRFDSSLWYRSDSRRAARSHFHRLRNGSSREVRKDCRERERWCARITPRPSGDVSRGCPTSGSLPAISFKLTLLMEGPPRSGDRLRFPHFQLSLSPSSLSHENYSLVRFPSDGKSNLLTDPVLHPCTKKRLFKSAFAPGLVLTSAYRYLLISLLK